MPQKHGPVRIAAEYGVAISLLWLLQHLPKRPALALSRVAARLLDRSLPKLRRVGHINLSFAYPQSTREDRDAILDGVFLTIARLLFALARFPSLTPANVREWIEYEGLEHYQSAKSKGKGVLIATAHLGNWELSAFAHALMTEPMHVMVRPLDNPKLDRLVEDRRQGSGNRLIFKKEAARRVLKVLRENNAVGILVDQNSSPAEGVFVNFFGVKACANAAFVKFANHSDAAVLLGFALWDNEKNRYVLRFYPELELSGDVEVDTQLVHSELEHVVRQYPEQWMWIHRRWKTRPPGEAGVYS